ncbi:MAG TPA: OmpA family protein [Candidatus Kapabacteria bacterium]|nr:OmpA family protein [Candidatus Kapabacteria bacterium]
MKRILLLAAALLSACLLPRVATAQPVADEVVARVGVFGGTTVNIHSASFQQLPGTPSCCPEYTSGTGIGGAVGLMYEHLIGGPFELALRAGFEGRGATLETTQPFAVIVDGQRFDAEILHTLETSLPVIAIEPMLGVRLGGLRLMLGPHIGVVTGGTFEQREELIKPEEIGTFENLRRVRNEASGTIPNLSALAAGIVAGVSYDLPLDRERNLLASPELMFLTGLTNVTEDLEWHAHALRLGVALRYQFKSAGSTVAPTIAVDTTAVRPDRAPLQASIRALAVGPDGSERTDVTFSVEEFISTNMRPLLNYVFFEEGGATIPPRYQRADAARFDVRRLHSLDAIGTYHHLLDIVGQRLRERPSSRVTLIGCSAASGADTSMALSRARAVAVRDYLRSVWGISDDRLRVEARSLPSKPSDSTTLDGRQENRRVEIVTDDAEILAPVVTLDTLRSVTPPIVRFRTTASAGADAAWRVDVRQHGAVIRAFEGSGPPPAYIDWNTNADQHAVPSAGDSLQYALRVTGRDAREAVAAEALAVNVVTLRRKREERIGDRVIDRYSLILFDFDRAALEGVNLAIAQDVRSRIGPGANVSVTGSTDRIGDEAYNEKLSLERARNVAKILDVAPERVSGLGERSLLFDNELPEGRFYSRTVTIVVETPVQ